MGSRVRQAPSMAYVSIAMKIVPSQFIGLQSSIAADWKLADRELAKLDPHHAADVVSELGQHPLNLPIAPFAKRDVQDAAILVGVDDFDLGGRGAAFREPHAATELL